MSEIRRTAAQVKAIESVGASVCVRAGAGTGKTFVLVGRYMELLRRRKVESVREIAALTYTGAKRHAIIFSDRVEYGVNRFCRDSACRIFGKRDCGK